MTVRNRLKSTAAPASFLHLSSIPRKPAAPTEATPAAEAAAPAASAAEAPTASAAAPAAEAATPAAPAPAVAAPAADEECHRGEDDDDDDDDDDPEGDEEEVKKAQAAGHGAALAAATRMERRRCAAIFSSEHAVGRVPLACELAFDVTSNMKASKVIKVLSATAPESDTNPLAEALVSMPRYDIGQSGVKPGAKSPDQELLAAAQDRAKATSKKQ
jgi:hypothetical protein